MSRRLPSLNALRAFEAAARHVSVSLAAAEMNVTHAAVSRHIRDLEAWLGTKLFHRTGRGVELTSEGERLGRELTPAFDTLEQAIEAFAAPGRRDRLVISAEIPLAALWLAPRLGRFTAKHPAIDLVVDPSNRLVDFAKGEADLGIRYGGGRWRGVEAIKLLESEVTPVCSPALIERTRIRSPADLPGALLLQEEPKQHWLDWLKAAGVAENVAPAGPVLKGHLAIAAAEAGQGFALADVIQAGDALRAGRLVRPFTISVKHQAYYLVRGESQRESKAASAFRGWITSEIELTKADLAVTAIDHRTTRSASARKRRDR